MDETRGVERPERAGGGAVRCGAGAPGGSARLSLRASVAASTRVGHRAAPLHATLDELADRERCRWTTSLYLQGLKHCDL